VHADQPAALLTSVRQALQRDAPRSIAAQLH